MATMPFTPCSSDPCTDVTVSILQTVFGPVIRNLTLGVDPSGVDPVVNVIATMMGYFNSGVLTIATLIVSFVTVVGVINTANDGESFGRNWSSLWTPVRIVSGAAVLLPTGTGYSFIQLMVMMFSLWAVGFANGVFEVGVKNGIIAGSLQNVSQQVGVGGSATANKKFPLYNMREFAGNYLATAYCAKAVNTVYADGLVSGLTPPNIARFSTPDRTAVEANVKIIDTYEMKDRNAASSIGGGRAVCGTVSIYKYAPTATNPVGAYDSLIKAFNNQAQDANSTAIGLLRDKILAAKIVAINGMTAELDEWVLADWPGNITNDWSGVSVNRFNQIVDKANSNILTTLQDEINGDQTLRTLMDRFSSEILSDGWAMAGGYYQRLGGIREEFRKIYSESPGEVTQPAMRWLPEDAKGDLVRQSMVMVNTVIQKAVDGTGHTPTSITDTSNVNSIFPADLDDVDIDQMGSRGNKVMNSLVGNVMEGVTNAAIGADGDVDAMARIKTTGDILAVANSTLHAVSKTIEATSGAAVAAAASTAATPVAGGIYYVAAALKSVVDVILIQPLKEILFWLDPLAFYFGIFLPSLPYTIFMIAVVGWFLAVLQTVFAAPLWAVMHMSPDRTFVGSQTQGYLMFLSLFMRPALIMAALFAAMLLANPIILYISKAFWAMRTANVSSSESIGFLVQFLTWKNWLIMYGMLLLPVVYMIFGLTNALPDAILTWIGAGIKPLGETQATSEMRSGMEKAGGKARSHAALSGAGGGAEGGAGRLPRTGSGGNSRAGAVPSGADSRGENRLLSDMGQANVSSVPDHVPADTAKSKGSEQKQNDSRHSGAAGAAAAAAGAGAALVASSAVAGQEQDDALETPSATQAQKGADGDTAYEPVNTDARPMHNDTPVQEPGHAMHVDKDGRAIHEGGARSDETDESDAVLNQSMETPPQGRGEDDAIAA